MEKSLKCDWCDEPIDKIPDWPLVVMIEPGEYDPELGIWCSEECRDADDEEFLSVHDSGA